MISTTAVGLEVGRAALPAIRRDFPWAVTENVLCYQKGVVWNCSLTANGAKGEYASVTLKVTLRQPPKHTYISRLFNGSVRTHRYHGKTYGLKVVRTAWEGIA